MKTIGLLGGMTPEATRAYYDALIALGRRHLEGPLQNPVVIIYSLDLSVPVRYQRAGQTDKVVDHLAEVFDRLHRAGAEVGALTANTPHVYFDELAARAAMPLVSIVEATAEHARELGVKRALLLGTEITMGSDMYANRCARDGIELVVPDPDDRGFIDHVIYEELSVGKVRLEVRERLLGICRAHLERNRVDAVFLACTELPLALAPDDLPVPLIDTVQVHARAIFEAASE